MAKIVFHAGDFGKGDGNIFPRSSILGFSSPNTGLFKTNTYLKAQIESVSLASEENVKKLGGAVGWGVAGAVLLGPIGLLAGLLAGGKKKETTFIVNFTDGKKFLATTDSKTYTDISAMTF